MKVLSLEICFFYGFTSGLHKAIEGGLASRFVQNLRDTRAHSIYMSCELQGEQGSIGEKVVTSNSGSSQTSQIRHLVSCILVMAVVRIMMLIVCPSSNSYLEFPRLCYHVDLACC